MRHIDGLYMSLHNKHGPIMEVREIYCIPCIHKDPREPARSGRYYYYNVSEETKFWGTRWNTIVTHGTTLLNMLGEMENYP